MRTVKQLSVSVVKENKKRNQRPLIAWTSTLDVRVHVPAGFDLTAAARGSVFLSSLKRLGRGKESEPRLWKRWIGCTAIYGQSYPVINNLPSDAIAFFLRRRTLPVKPKKQNISTLYDPLSSVTSSLHVSAGTVFDIMARKAGKCWHVSFGTNNS